MFRLLDRCFKYCFLAVYTVVSIVIFDSVYEATSEVIDELFHVGQGLQYCQGNFTAVIIFHICLHFFTGKLHRFSIPF